MKKFYLLISFSVIAILFFALNRTYAQNIAKQTKAATSETGIQFIEQDWSNALQQAKTNNKLVFLDIYATWCGPCKMLKKKTFTDKAVGEFFNKNFVNVSVDGEKGVGPTLEREYQIQAYPTLIITDASGKPVLYTMGYIDSKTLLEFAQAALKKKG